MNRGWLRHDLTIGVIASFVAGIAINAIHALGMDRGLATAFVLATLTTVLFRCFKEEMAPFEARRFLLLAGAGCVSALTWIAFAWARHANVTYSAESWLDYPVAIISLGVIAPLYEEKLVRHVLLRGAAQVFGGWAAILATSIAFALVHAGNFLFSLVFGMVLAWLALRKGIDTVQRAVIHGTYNLAVFGWYLAHGNGI